jgi:hypothetical protein
MTRSQLRKLRWGIGLGLLTVAAFAIAVSSRGGGEEPVAQLQPVAQNINADPPRRKSVPFSPEARDVAAEFLSTAVPRRNLERSWQISHPELRQGYTLKQWLTGTIPVQYYPTGKVDLAAFRIDESYADEAAIQVILYPNETAKVRPQVFFVTLKKHGGTWKVSYFAPRGGPGRNVTGEGAGG